MKRFGLLMAAAVGLTGCSAQEALNFALKNRDLLASGGTNEYDVYDREFDTIAADAGILGTQIPAVPVPTTGTAQFEGIAQVTIAIPGSNPGLLAGDLTLDANYRRGTVTGDITRVFDSAGESYSSDLDINGSLRGSDFTPLDARLTGTLTDGQSNTWTADAQVDGAFAGPSAEYVAGSINGTATVAGGGQTAITGQFVAEEQPQP